MLLYHYCDNKKMASIISGHTLRMSDIAKSNDYEEIQLFYPYIMTEIENEYKNEPFQLEYKNEKDFDALKKLLYETHRCMNMEFDIGEMTSFVVCFCEDGDALSQWRGYADGGKGGAIGFSLDELSKYCSSYGGILQLVKVQYISKRELDEIIIEKAKDVLRKFKVDKEKMLDNFSFSQNTEEYNILIQTRILRIIKNVLIGSLEYKNEAFFEENEWRMFFRKVITKNPEWIFGDKDAKIMQFDKVITKLKDKIDFNITDSDWIPFYPINLFEISDHPIKEIILGPNNAVLRRDFELFLGKNGMKNVDFRISRIPFKG